MLSEKQAAGWQPALGSMACGLEGEEGGAAGAQVPSVIVSYRAMSFHSPYL